MKPLIKWWRDSPKSSKIKIEDKAKLNFGIHSGKKWRLGSIGADWTL